MNRRSSLREGEVARLLQGTEGEVQLAIALMLFGGLRAGEVAELYHRDVIVDPNGVVIRVRRGAKEDQVKAVGLLRDLLVEHRGDPDELVIGRTTSGVHDTLHRAMRSQGFTVCFHALRHTYATSRAGD